MNHNKNIQNSTKCHEMKHLNLGVRKSYKDSIKTVFENIHLSISFINIRNAFTCNNKLIFPSNYTPLTLYV